jgi:hypothetical protein
MERKDMSRVEKLLTAKVAKKGRKGRKGKIKRTTSPLNCLWCFRELCESFANFAV